MNKEIFRKFLRENYPEKYNSYLQVFRHYLELILEINSSINLVSRKTSEDEYWTKHFLDSILPHNSVEFSNKKILDFGTGGGMPGVPLKIVFPTSEMYLLDSRGKKIEALKNIIKKLDLSGCFTIVSRLEDMNESWNEFFDLIVCRAVKIIPKYKKNIIEIVET